MVKKIMIIMCICMAMCTVTYAEETGQMPQEQTDGGMRPPNMQEFAPPDAQGEMPENRQRPNMQEFVPPDAQGEMPENWQRPNMQGGGFGGRGGMGMPWEAQEEAEIQQTEKMGIKGFLTEYFTPVISLVMLGFAFLFVIFYKRKKY